jgi:hypothetical protein
VALPEIPKLLNDVQGSPKVSIYLHRTFFLYPHKYSFLESENIRSGVDFLRLEFQEWPLKLESNVTSYWHLGEPSWRILKPVPGSLGKECCD